MRDIRKLVGKTFPQVLILGLSFTRFFPPREVINVGVLFSITLGASHKNFSRSSSSGTLIGSIVVLRLAREPATKMRAIGVVDRNVRRPIWISRAIRSKSHATKPNPVIWRTQRRVRFIFRSYCYVDTVHKMQAFLRRYNTPIQK